MKRGQGQWQAYVVKGDTKEIRRTRLDEVPGSMRDEVKSHVITYFKIRGSRK